MRRKKLSKQQLLEEIRNANRKFNQDMIKGFGILFLIITLIQFFYIYGCDTKYYFRTYYLFQKEISPALVCMSESKLKYHESKIFEINNQKFSACGTHCKSHLTNCFTDFAITKDAFSQEKINKSTAIIGLKKKGKPELVYFKNKHNFNKYYSRIIKKETK